VPTPTPKDYFFDGATGVYQSADNSVTRIYPTMRRGGRMIYAFDVSATSYNSTTHTGNPPSTPTFLWSAGCPNMGNNTGCTSGMSAIGQTWSTPQPAVLKDGNTVLSPVVIFGGGYDSTQTTSGGVVTSTSCEDQNTQSPSCGSRTGNAVYIVDGQNGPGTLLKTFTLPNTHGTPGSVVGDISLLDVNGDGYTDYAYLADTNGFVYRIDFVDGPVTLVPQSQGSWAATQIAGVSNTANYGRKFMFGPTLFLNQNKVYLGLGTGDREHPLITQYPYTTPVLNHFYLFVDDPATTGTYVNLDGTTMQSGVGALCSTTPVLPQNTANPSATAPIGFYLPLNAHGTGEQTVTPALIIGGQVTWGTNRPLPPLANACTNGLGEARGYLVDLVNGSGALNVTGECTDTTAATSTTNQSTVYPGGGLPIPPTEAIVPVTNTPPGAGGDGGGGGGGGGDGSGANPSCTPDTCSYVNVCIGCPPKDTGCSPSNISACDVTGTIPSARRRIYWFTPDDK